MARAHVPPGDGRVSGCRDSTMSSATFSAEEHQMKPGLGPAITLLAILGIIDLLQVPFMVAAQQHAGEPPTAAIIAIVIVGLVTLASAAGLAQGRRRAATTAVTCRVLDSVSALLGLTHRPSTALFYGSAVILVLSIAAIASLARLSLGRRPQRSTAQARP
jgi:hypothetical protein